MIEDLIRKHKFKEAFELIAKPEITKWSKHFYKAQIYTKQIMYEEAIGHASESLLVATIMNDPFKQLESRLLLSNLYTVFRKNSLVSVENQKIRSLLGVLSYFKKRFNVKEIEIFIKAKRFVINYDLKLSVKRSDRESIEKLIKNLEDLIVVNPMIKIDCYLLRKEFLQNDISIQKIINEFEELKNQVEDHESIETMFNLAGMLLTQREYSKALSMYKTCKEIAEKYHIHKILLDSIGNINLIRSTTSSNPETQKETDDLRKLYLKLRSGPLPNQVSEYPITRQKLQNPILYKIENATSDIGDVLNLVIYLNDFMIIRGSKGSGKSTLLRYLLCLDYPQKGAVFYKDNNLGKLIQEDLVKLRKDNMAFISNEKVLIPRIQNSKPDLNQITDPVTKSISNELLSFIEERDEFLHYQILANQLLNLLVTQPKVIIMEEPFVEMKFELVEKFLQLFKSYQNSNNVTIVMETHHHITSEFANVQIFLRNMGISTIVE